MVLVKNKWSMSEEAFLELMKKRKTVILNEILVQGGVGAGVKKGEASRELVYQNLKCQQKCIKARLAGKPCPEASKSNSKKSDCDCNKQ